MSANDGRQLSGLAKMTVPYSSYQELNRLDHSPGLLRWCEEYHVDIACVIRFGLHRTPHYPDIAAAETDIDSSPIYVDFRHGPRHFRWINTNSDSDRASKLINLMPEGYEYCPDPRNDLSEYREKIVDFASYKYSAHEQLANIPSHVFQFPTPSLFREDAIAHTLSKLASLMVTQEDRRDLFGDKVRRLAAEISESSNYDQQGSLYRIEDRSPEDLIVVRRRAGYEALLRQSDLSNPLLSDSERLRRAARLLKAYERLRKVDPDFRDNGEELRSARRIQKSAHRERQKAEHNGPARTDSTE